MSGDLSSQENPWVNKTLFKNLIFIFEGLGPSLEKKFNEIVQSLGGNDFERTGCQEYFLTTTKFFHLTGPLRLLGNIYNIEFLWDCIQKEELLDIELYRFSVEKTPCLGSKYILRTESCVYYHFNKLLRKSIKSQNLIEKNTLLNRETKPDKNQIPLSHRTKPKMDFPVFGSPRDPSVFCEIQSNRDKGNTLMITQSEQLYQACLDITPRPTGSSSSGSIVEQTPEDSRCSTLRQNLTAFMHSEKSLITMDRDKSPSQELFQTCLDISLKPTTQHSSSLRCVVEKESEKNSSFYSMNSKRTLTEADFSPNRPMSKKSTLSKTTSNSPITQNKPWFSCTLDSIFGSRNPLEETLVSNFDASSSPDEFATCDEQARMEDTHVGSPNQYMSLKYLSGRTEPCRIEKCEFAPIPHDIHDKKSRNFSKYELELIIKYLYNENYIADCKDSEIYKKLFEDGFLTHRTFMSMQNTVKKKILKNLHMFNLRPDVLNKFVEVCSK